MLSNSLGIIRNASTEKKPIFSSNRAQTVRQKGSSLEKRDLRILKNVVPHSKVREDKYYFFMFMFSKLWVFKLRILSRLSFILTWYKMFGFQGVWKVRNFFCCGFPLFVIIKGLGQQR